MTYLYATTPYPFNGNTIADMRGWLLDIATDDEMDLVEDLSEDQVCRQVARLYAGGLSGFMVDIHAGFRDYSPREYDCHRCGLRFGH